MIGKRLMASDHQELAIEIRVRYLAALIDCDRSAAKRAIDQGLASGLDLPTLLLQVLAPAQWEMGELWHRAEVTIAQEHWGTETTRHEIERVLVANPPDRLLDRSVIVAGVPDEIHTLPARIIAGLFWWRGWSVDYLGQAPPVDGFVDYVRHREPDLVALSMTLRSRVEGTTALCSRLKALDPAPFLLVGGTATADLNASDLGADALATEALEGLAAAAEGVGLSTNPDPKTYLALVGGRIQRLREQRGLSQAELSKRSGLTRPYLSAIERGRQNITLEAGLKIASALEVGMSELLG